MPISNKLPPGLDEVDILIAGGGTAGCIIAARVAAADPSLSVLLIEAGPNNDRDSVLNPALFYENLTPDSGILNIHPDSKPSSALGGRPQYLVSANVLGGGSSINLMLYVRAQRCDFDSWKTPGWTADELLPYLKRLETNHKSGDTHGNEGPVLISQGGFSVPHSQQDIIEACVRVGYRELDDLQDLESCNGVERHLGNISPQGQRQDSAHTYLHPLLERDHPHLHVLCEHKVVRVLFDSDKRACGVEVVSRSWPQPETSTQTIRARKLVVISSGALGTPLILERSGIGASQHLNRAGVNVISELPGVGENYQDHPLLWIPYRTNLEAKDTGDALMTGVLPRDEALRTKHSMLGWNYTDVMAKIRPSEDDLAALGTDFQKIWDRDFRDHPERPLTMSGFINVVLLDRTSIPAGQYISTAAYSAYPYGRGHVHITGSSLSDPVDLDSGYLQGSNEEAEFDLQTHVWSYKKHREIMRRTKLYRGELETSHPLFPDGSAVKAVNLLDENTSLIEKGDVSDLVYSADDDAAIRDYVRARLNTAGHSLGTAKMAPKDEGGVVDSKLDVYGVQGLKVADLSIVPENVGANTCNTAMMVGEKAAAIILGELGLEEV